MKSQLNNMSDGSTSMRKTGHRFVLYQSGKDLAENPNNSPSDFSVELVQPIEFDPDHLVRFYQRNYRPRYEMCCKKFTYFLDFPNVSEELNNIQFTYNTGVVQRNLIIESGSYTPETLNAELHTLMRGVGDYTVVNGQEVYSINIARDPDNGSIELTITDGYSWDLTVGLLRELLGAQNQVYTEGFYVFSTPDFLRYSEYFLECNLVNARGSIRNGRQSKTLLYLSPIGAPGELVENISDTYVEVETEGVGRLEFRLCDELGVEVPFKSFPSFELHFRPQEYTGINELV